MSVHYCFLGIFLTDALVSVTGFMGFDILGYSNSPMAMHRSSLLLRRYKSPFALSLPLLCSRVCCTRDGLGML